jgi:hypothetical protein
LLHNATNRAYQRDFRRVFEQILLGKKNLW